MMTSILRFLLHTGGRISLIGLATVSVMAQQDRGTILGLVQDPSEAVVANATVLIQNQVTGKELRLTTDSSGLFVAPELPVGTYRVSASSHGFKTTLQENIVLRVSDRTRLVLTLEPGRSRRMSR
jgi:Carboxypeptidase regulatory-like domain